MANMDQIAAVGRRKTAVARVILVPGSGAVMINGMELKDRFARAAFISATVPYFIGFLQVRGLVFQG